MRPALSSVTPPKSWPSSVRYVKKPMLSTALTAQQLSKICVTNIDFAHSTADHHTIQDAVHASPRAVKIREINDSSHPAFGQYGLFAARHLESSTFILIYLGYVHGEDEADSASDYDLSLDRDYGVSVDARAVGNEARFINDYRGISLQGPNAEFKDCWLRVQSQGAQQDVKYVKCIGVFVLPAGKSGKRKDGIAIDAEILVSYGKGFWRQRAGLEEANPSIAEAW